MRTNSHTDTLRCSVVGPTGAGKTTFINYAIGRDDDGIKDSLNYNTTRVEWIKSTNLIDGWSVTFIDTPGFDGTTGRVIDVMAEIQKSPQNASRTPKLDAILYFHRISDNRMGGSELKCLTLFASLYDIDATTNVALVTTMWDQVTKECGEKREEELKAMCQTILIENGCEVKRFYRTIQSTLDVLRPSLSTRAVNEDRRNNKASDERTIVYDLIATRNIFHSFFLSSVMGPTGVGKTTFINCVAKRGDRGVGHDIESCTSKVSLINVGYTIHDRKVVLVDTPGFDDTYKSDIEILTMIAEFLVKADQRMTGSLLKNLKMFVSLCGIQSMPIVTIVTTMWSRVLKEVGEARERELKQKMWFDMIEKGCNVKRFDGTYQSALDILADAKTVTAPLLSTEMVAQRKKLKATAAGHELAQEIKNLVKQRKAANRKLQELFKDSKDETERRLLEEEMNEANRKIKETGERLAVLKRNVFERFFGPKPDINLVPQVGEIL
ncbi:hypothetical protein FRC16_009108 [Serendipita sp. 398]|nr:hypothetical protein FRC16_009108 [Serendipita sp. 398]